MEFGLNFAPGKHRHTEQKCDSNENFVVSEHAEFNQTTTDNYNPGIPNPGIPDNFGIGIPGLRDPEKFSGFENPGIVISGSRDFHF